MGTTCCASLPTSNNTPHDVQDQLEKVLKLNEENTYEQEIAKTVYITINSILQNDKELNLQRAKLKKTRHHKSESEMPSNHFLYSFCDIIASYIIYYQYILSLYDGLKITFDHKITRFSENMYEHSMNHYYECAIIPIPFDTNYKSQIKIQITNLQAGKIIVGAFIVPKIMVENFDNQFKHCCCTDCLQKHGLSQKNIDGSNNNNNNILEKSVLQETSFRKIDIPKKSLTTETRNEYLTLSEIISRLKGIIVLRNRNVSAKHGFIGDGKTSWGFHSNGCLGYNSLIMETTNQTFNKNSIVTLTYWPIKQILGVYVDNKRQTSMFNQVTPPKNSCLIPAIAFGANGSSVKLISIDIL